MTRGERSTAPSFVEPGFDDGSAEVSDSLRVQAAGQQSVPDEADQAPTPLLGRAPERCDPCALGRFKLTLDLRPPAGRHLDA